MAFSKKMQDVFSRLAVDILRLGKDFDFIAESKAIDKYLEDADVNMKTPQFLAAVFDELDAPRSNWKPDKDDLLAFFQALPERIRKERVTDDILIKYIPKDKWGSFKKEYHKASSAFRENLGSNPIILAKAESAEGRALVTVAVKLGDIVGKIGVTDGELKSYTYKYVYSAVDNLLGAEAVLALLKKRLPRAQISILDCPNAACLKDASYEVLFKMPGDAQSKHLCALAAKAAVFSVLKEIGILN